MRIVHKLLEHPLTKELSVDDPKTTLLRRQIINEKSFLKSIYSEWYSLIMKTFPQSSNVLELGSGAGFLKTVYPEIITSEIMYIEGVDIIVDGCMLPFEKNVLNGIVMTDVLHHIPDVEAFLNEALRCLKVGGKIVMVEPWNTRWSKWIYTNFHSEPFIVDSGWKIPSSGPLSGANGALPWIVFERDYQVFQKQFSKLRINEIKPLMPISYLISGGVSMRSLIPGWFYKPTRYIEKWFEKSGVGMFALIELEKIN